MLSGCADIETGPGGDVMYFVLIDRFADGDSSNNFGSNPESYEAYAEENPDALRKYQGGDLQGIINRLAYLDSLGVTMLWLSPFLDNSNTDYVGWWPYHGYHPIDFYAVDEHFGTLEDLKRLVSEAHERGMKVIFDMPFNQTAADHPWVSDSTKLDWFHHDTAGQPFDISDWFDQDQIERGELHGLPDLAQENPQVAKYLVDVSKYWIDQTQCDGFRLDAVKHIPLSFWNDYNRQIKAYAGDDFLLLGEVFWGDAERIKPYVNSGFDMLFHIPGYYAIRNTFNKGGSFQDFSQFYAKTGHELGDTKFATIIDNHDVARFNVGLGANAWEKQKLALGWLVTSPGLPVVYYGSELGVQGYPAVDSEGRGQDYLNRLPFPGQMTPVQLERVEEFKHIMNLRRNHPVLSGNVFHEIYKDWSIYAYLRSDKQSSLLLILNNATTEEFVAIPQPADYEIQVHEKIFGEGVVRYEGDELYFRLPPLSMTVWDVNQPVPDALPVRTEFTDRLSGDYTLARFSYADASREVARLQVAGDFNNWNPSVQPSRRQGDTLYVDIPVKRGTYEYKLVLNGDRWLPDPAADSSVADPFGSRNSVFSVFP